MLKALFAAGGATTLAFIVYVLVSICRITGGRPGVSVDLGYLLSLTFHSASFWVLMMLVFGCVFARVFVLSRGASTS